MTSDKEFLSQEEIDALLKRTEEELAPAIASEPISEMEMDALGEIGNISLGSSATALSTLLGLKVEITTPKVSLVEKEDLYKEFPIPHVAVYVDYVEGLKGANVLVIRNRDAQIIADLMMGGDGQPAEEGLTDIHISAVGEAMNQMMGSAATSMSTIFNRFVNIGPPGVDLLDLAEGSQSTLPTDETLLKISFRLKIGDLVDSNMMQLIPMSFGKYLVSLLMNENGTLPKQSPMTSPNQHTDQLVNHSVKMEGGPTMTQSSPKNDSALDSGVGNSGRSASATGSGHERQVQVQPVQFSAFDHGSPIHQEQANLNLLMDIPLKVTVELGRTSKLIREILELSQGSIIELDKLAGEPVDILVNNKLIAKGEVVVIEENFGVRVTDIISQWDRVQKLQ